MEDDNIITAAQANGLIEVVHTDGLTLPTDLDANTALLADGTLNGQQVIILTTEDGKVTGISGKLQNDVLVVSTFKTGLNIKGTQYAA